MNTSFKWLPLAALVLCGCATSAPNPAISVPDNETMLAPGVSCALPPPGAAVGNVSAAQTIAAHFRGQTFSFDAQIQSTADEFDLVALDSLGRRAMSVKWQGGQISFTRADWLPVSVRPADILGDIAVVFWPAGTVGPALAACGAKLTTTPNGRAVTVRNRNVIEVTYAQGQGWNRGAHLRNRAFGFSIDIQSAEIAQ